MKTSGKTLLILVLSFGIYHFLDGIYFKALRQWLFELTGQIGVSHMITYTISGIPLFLGTYLIGRKSGFFDILGLNKSINKGFLFALICTLPMYIGFSIFFKHNPEVSLNTFLISVVSAGFFEELFFRGFLFGILFRKTKLGFIPAVFFGAFYFGLLHLYQSTELIELLGIFSITFLGGILFAWAYAEWNYNIWIPIFLHMLMNLSYELFNASDNALGGIYSNVFRLATVVLIIVLTILYKKKNRMKLEIDKKNIFIKKI